MLDMGDVADALIGSPGAGLNLEKRKRVSVGVELAAKPDILLFLDEPTSGKCLTQCAGIFYEIPGVVVLTKVIFRPRRRLRLFHHSANAQAVQRRADDLVYHPSTLIRVDRAI